MLVNIRYKEVKVRRRNSGQFDGADKFSGTVTYYVIGSLGGKFVRLSLGTQEKAVAVRRVRKLESACSEGPLSSLWQELYDSLPRKTFEAFADFVGYVKTDVVKTTQPTWSNLCEAYELEMERRIQNQLRGDTKQTMKPQTRDRYRMTIRHFGAFLQDPQTRLDTISESTIELYKLARQKAITQLKQSRGGSSIALDIAVLHGMFKFAVKRHLMARKPIELENETKPGANPTNGARPLTAAELTKLREAAELVNDGGKIRKPSTALEKNLKETTGGDLFIFLVLRWTGLRGSDAVTLQWKHVHFDRGSNGEIEKVTQKRDKLAIIPLSSELRSQLEEMYLVRKPNAEDLVLLSPDTGRPLVTTKRLRSRCAAMGLRAGVKVTPHCFRDTFACDMLARGIGVFEVAKMLADTVKTIEEYYAQFVPAARDAVQTKMDSGIGIEEQAKLAKQRATKVVAIRG